MKLIRTEDAVGHVLCHDMTQIIKDKYKDARFRKGHVVTEEDIPVLLSMGKEHLYVWEMTPGMLHENDAAERLLTLCGQGEYAPQRGQGGQDRAEGRLRRRVSGRFPTAHRRDQSGRGDDCHAQGRYSRPQKRQARGHARHPTHHRGGKAPKERKRAAGKEPLLALKPFVRKTACIVATGSEVKKGLIQDTFTPVVIDKLKTYGIETLEVVYSGDGVENVRDAVLAMRERKPDVILCTGGMSVDPDDNTPGGIRAAGADIVCYGAPVLPGAMFLLGYFEDGTPVMGLPGCVMYAGATVFDLVLPKVAADVPVTRADIAAMGEGGLCLGCKPCRYPVCPFGK